MLNSATFKFGQSAKRGRLGNIDYVIMFDLYLWLASTHLTTTKTRHSSLCSFTAELQNIFG